MKFTKHDDMVSALISKNVIANHHKPDPSKGGMIYEGTPATFEKLKVSNGCVSFTHIGTPLEFPLTEMASVQTL
jgi:hypothetical protein